MPEDVAIASTKSEVDTCTDDRDIDRPKSADRQTDGQTAFQLYIVDFHNYGWLCHLATFFTPSLLIEVAK